MRHERQETRPRYRKLEKTGWGINMKRRDRGDFRAPLKQVVAPPVEQGKQRFFAVHVTSVGAGRNILEEGMIEARYCRHFGKNLVYFFLNRAGYRPSGSEEKSDQINRFPFVFIQPLEKMGALFHAYPFDTGAALGGIFDEKADPYVYLEDYELEANFDGLSRHIHWAFDSSLDYFKGVLNYSRKETLAPWQSTERSFFDIAQLASPSHNRPDTRASAIELAIDASFGISGKATKIIFPKQLMESGASRNIPWLELISSRSVTWATYNWMPNCRPIDFFNEINDQIKTHIFDG